MKFTKMQGCGNDYVYVNGFTEHVAPEDKPDLVRRLSDRHFGIGGDGVIFINPAEEADFEMEMYNADGTRSQMCGNGIRCVGKFVYDKGLTDKEKITVVSAGSVKLLELTVERGTDADDARGYVKSVRVNMGSPILEPEQIPVKAEGERAIDIPITVDGGEYRMTCVSMGNPHAVTFVEDTGAIKIETIGPEFEHHPMFPERVNTEFIQILSRNEINMRVWERGSGETLACGTGACASVYACIINGLTDKEVLVHLLGGDLSIRLDDATGHIFMTGPAVTVYDGEWFGQK